MKYIAFVITFLIVACSTSQIPMESHISYIEETENGLVYERILFDPGGSVKRGYKKWRDRRERYNIQFYKIDGICASFCALAAWANDRTCYTESAVVGFHPVGIMGLVETPETIKVTNWFLTQWPPKLSEYWENHPPSFVGYDLYYDDLKAIIPEKEC